MKCALYARVSTRDQNNETQLGQLRQWVQAHGWEVYKEYTDVKSGAKRDRKALERLLKDAKAGRFDMLVVWKLDRLGRSVSHLLAMLDELRGYSVGFAATTQGIDTSTAGGRMLMGFLAVIAEFERELIRERTLAGLERARSNGVRLGRPQVEIDLDKLVGLRTRGLSQASIAKRMGIGRGTVQRALTRAGLRPAPGASGKAGNSDTPSPDSPSASEPA